MFGYRLDFDCPQYLLLLVLVPVVWLLGRRSFVSLGRWRRWTVFGLRAAVVTAFVLALAEAHIVRTSERLAVMYVLDRSLSIAPDRAKAAIDFVNSSRAAGHDRKSGDLAGVIVFGRQAAVELPPLADDVPLLNVESQVDGEHTDLAGALRLARACFPPECAKRVVILSDGNENLESALNEARSLADAEIGIDVVPLGRVKAGDVAVEKITVPAEVRRGSPFDVRIVLSNSHEGPEQGGQTVSGRLMVYRKAGGREELVADKQVEVAPGKQVFAFREEINAPEFYTYEAQFVPDAGTADLMPQNNRATAFTQVHGHGRVLLIEDWAHPGEFAYAVERLRQTNLQVEVRPSSNAFANLAELQAFDTVILANVPRTSGDDAGDLTEFADEQIEMLVHNTQQTGGGLVMLGGPNSFGAGGWANTALEKAMPVDFQVKNLKVVPSGALMLVIDHSGSMTGDKLEMSKAAAVAALKVLGERDYVGVVAFDSEAHWVVPIARVGSGNRSAVRIMQLGAGGGTNMMPGMTEGYRALGRVETSIKHMIVLTDGRTEGNGYQALSDRMRKQGITTTCVAIGRDSDGPLMNGIAKAGGGKFYQVDQPTAIPRVFMKEARRVARPLVYENENGFQPQLDYPHEMLSGITAPLPPITGYVVTTVKDNPVVEISLSSPKPGPSRNPLLASWTYGLGRTVAWTTDMGQRWTKAWTGWESFDKLLAQTVRWSMRPSGGDGKTTLFAEARDGKLRIVVTALDKNDEFVNFLAMRGTVLDPKMQAAELAIEQTAPGRYVGECAVEGSGSYFVTIVPGRGFAPLRTGVNVPYSAEFRDVASNDALLASLAAQSPKRGVKGRVIDLVGSPTGTTSDAHIFRHDLPPALGRLPCWHLMVLCAACLFFCDVFHRRVAVSTALEPAAKKLAGLLRRKREVKEPSQALDRLRQRKDELVQQLDDRRAAVRFEYTAEALRDDRDAARTLPRQAAELQRPEPLAPQEDDGSYTSYTERLLKAKRKARDK